MLSLLLISVCLLLPVASCKEYVSYIRRIEECPGVKDLPAKIHKIDMNYLGSATYTLTFNITLDRDLNPPIEMKFEVQKCVNEYGSCENFIDFTIPDVCTDMAENGSIVNSMFSMAKIERSCPIKKGEYTLNNSELYIHPDLLEAGARGSYWKFNVLLMKEPNRKLFCLYSEGKVTKVTKAKKRRGH